MKVLIKYHYYENESHCNDYSYGVSINIRDSDDASHTVWYLRYWGYWRAQDNKYYTETGEFISTSQEAAKIVISVLAI